MRFRWIFLAWFLCWFNPYVSAQGAGHYDVLIHEFLCDPDPSVGLPAYPFVELRNVCAYPLNLHNWKIGNGTATTTIRKDYLLLPDSFLILCPTQAEFLYSAFGPALGLAAFPSLNHDAGEIILTAESGSVIHAIQYDKSWYHNELKSAGGWSLEMIDPENPCSGLSNWTACEQSVGGTPGQPNSVFSQNPDQDSPELNRSVSPDSQHVLLFFNEPIDSLSAVEPANYTFSPDTGPPLEAIPVPPLYDQVLLKLARPMLPQQVYTVSVQQVTDCRANEIGIRNSCKAGLPEPPANKDLIFNEILFNPPPYGFDYVELFNRSRKVIDLQQVFLAGRDAMGAVKDPKRVTTGPLLFFPGEYVALTENPEWTTLNFTVNNPEKLMRMSALPSMPDDQGTLLLLDESGMVLDELPYDHHWHSPLLANEEGVSLERISTEKPTALASNWASAAATAGFGTPTYKNSESFTGTEADAEVSVEPRIFSPDNDGYNDYCFVKYHQLPGGFTANISIYDINGRPVRQLANNSTLGTEGNFRWDGLDDTLNPLPMGHYVICVDLFSVHGKIKKYKLVVTLAKRN
ncbi:MAG: hypothetical protein Q8918_13300 [Bacteroidota bacterium]|nr:hypothetical protein [Bacteroidota bacterium]MDP4251080.1 hypothetical protein [Bacteroidota bacterium]